MRFGRRAKGVQLQLIRYNVRPRRSRRWLPWIGYGLALGVVAWLWITIIGGHVEERRARKQAAGGQLAHAPESARTAPLGQAVASADPSAPLAAGGLKSSPGQPVPKPLPPVSTPPEASLPELLPAALQVAERAPRVSYLTIGHADGPKVTSVDVLVHALKAAGLDLQAAITRDRAQHPEHYGLKRRNLKNGTAKLAPALAPKNVAAFLATWSQRLTLAPLSGPSSPYSPGDLVFLDRKALRDGPLVGIVTMDKDASGVALVVTADPKDGVVTATHPLSDYRVRYHFRLSPRRLETIKARLEPVRAQRKGDAKIL
jgi:uncharacterized protein YijF (DUF1287 family)